MGYSGFSSIISILFISSTASALNLSYVSAEKRLLAESSELKQQRQAVTVSRENLRVGYSGLLPKASVNWTDQKKQNAAWDKSYSFDVEASLFAGGAEYSGLGALRARAEAEENTLKDNEDLLRARLARTLLGGALASEKIEVLKRSKIILDDRLTEQKRRFRLGQIREPDILQSQLESLHLDRSIETLQQDLAQSVATIKSMLIIEATESIGFPKLDSLLRELQQALKPRGDFALAALKNEKDALDYELKSVWRSHLPTLGAFANYGDVTTNPASWTMGLKAQWVFFQGLELPAQVRRAKAEARVFEEKLRQASLDRVINIGLKKSDLDSYQRKLQSVKDSKEMAKKAVQVQQVDYRRGIVTELEVLSSIENYQEIQTEELDLLNNIASAKISGLELGVSL